MRRAILVSSVVSLILLAGCQAGGNKAVFGEKVEGKPPTMKVDKVLDQTAQLEGKMVCVEGYITAVCPGSGCWIELSDQKDKTDKIVKVWFVYDKDEMGRVPVEAIGHKAMVQGKLVMQEVSVEELKHFAEEKGMSREEINRTITKPTKEPWVEGAYVVIEGIKPAEARACPGSHS
ncbi:MAG: DUF4920 domain-containing protein [Phycisphaerales bacterium]|nr:DUF4920 domain-containing protein [Phycisphaerales bacterium]